MFSGFKICLQFSQALKFNRQVKSVDCFMKKFLSQRKYLKLNGTNLLKSYEKLLRLLGKLTDKHNPSDFRDPGQIYAPPRGEYNKFYNPLHSLLQVYYRFTTVYYSLPQFDEGLASLLVYPNLPKIWPPIFWGLYKKQFLFQNIRSMTQATKLCRTQVTPQPYKTSSQPGFGLLFRPGMDVVHNS